MNLLATFNDNDFEPTDYTDRPTVKAVIINDKDEVLLFSGGLPGGGVEEGETNEQALMRECMEEIGATVSIDRELGNVIVYRDEIQSKYIFTGYLCLLISRDSPTTNIEHEMDKEAVWIKRVEAIDQMEAHLAEVKMKGKEIYEGDRYQRHIFNTETAILFLKAVGKN